MPKRSNKNRLWNFSCCCRIWKHRTEILYILSIKYVDSIIFDWISIYLSCGIKVAPLNKNHSWGQWALVKGFQHIWPLPFLFWLKCLYPLTGPYKSSNNPQGCKFFANEIMPTTSFMVYSEVLMKYTYQT